MKYPSLCGVFGVFILTSLLVSCSADRTLETITVTPSSGTQVMTQAGQTVQFRAIATYTKGTHPTTTRDVTSEVQWVSSNIAVATIDSGGLAKAVAGGQTEIRASMGGSLGIVSGSSDVKVSISGTDPHDLTSMTIIPRTGVQMVTNVGETAQFLAIGTFNSTPTTQDMTYQVTWKSSDVRVATINSTGLTTAVNSGQTTITAVFTTPSGAVITGGSDLTVVLGGGGGGVKLPSLTVYAVGLGSGTVTSNPPGINCSPTNTSGCTANFQLNANVQLTASPDGFGGWSANCTPTNSLTCTVTVNNNDTVGVIFNLK